MRKALLISLLCMVGLVACIEPNPLEFQPEEHAERVSVAYLKSLYRTAPVRIADAMQIEGRIVANDFNANLYKELVVADSTGGIVVRLDVANLYYRFWEGAQVTVRCNGLWLGSAGGTIELGAEPTDTYEVGRIPANDVGLYISTDSTRQAAVEVRTLTIAECAPESVSTLARFEKLQFIEEELTQGWCDEVIDSLTGEIVLLPTTRHLIDPLGDTIDLYTSPYADFVHTPLPSGSGSIKGLLGYFNHRYQLRILNIYHVKLHDERF